MRKFRRLLLIFFLLIAALLIYFFSAIHQSIPAIADRSAENLQRETFAPDFYKIKNNWLRKTPSGLWELYLEGDGFERGVINGKLTRELAAYQEKVFVDQIRQMVPSPGYLNFLKYFVAYFNRHLPQHIAPEYLEEIYGVSLSATDEFDHMAPKYYRILNYHSAHDIGHAIQDKNMMVGCTSFGVTRSASADGQPLLGRNFDFFAGDKFAENKIVCFTKPLKGNKYMYVTWAGFTGVVSGMNDKGLTLTINAAKSDIPNGAATPISILCKEILQYASNVKEALAIAEKRKTFVSESILIGSASENRNVIIEKTPFKTSLYEEKDDQLVCSNHFQGETFKQDFLNNKNIVESSSMYRKFRMQQLLLTQPKLKPENAAAILRDQCGINNKRIGMGNEKAMNQLIAHHAVIFQPGQLRIWISASPYQLGEFVCYDLRKAFDLAPAVKPGQMLNDSNLSIAADPFLYSLQFKNFRRFSELRKKIEFVTRSHFDLKIDASGLKAFAESNPDSYLTYWTLADYYKKQKNFAEAAAFYKQALTCEVPTFGEKEKISSHLKLVEDEQNKKN